TRAIDRTGAPAEEVAEEPAEEAPPEAAEEEERELVGAGVGPAPARPAGRRGAWLGGTLLGLGVGAVAAEGLWRFCVGPPAGGAPAAGGRRGGGAAAQEGAGPHPRRARHGAAGRDQRGAGSHRPPAPGGPGAGQESRHRAGPGKQPPGAGPARRIPLADLLAT